MIPNIESDLPFFHEDTEEDMGNKVYHSSCDSLLNMKTNCNDLE